VPGQDALAARDLARDHHGQHDESEQECAHRDAHVSDEAQRRESLARAGSEDAGDPPGRY
jgi:ABC-type nickel/cobalt efflux system permease component RcnA